jgi:G:T-mismatch repair DNA endonuclease (very short patch repair protein)
MQTATIATSRIDFWIAKFEASIRRDRHTIRDLRKFGWNALVVCECQTKHIYGLKKTIENFFDQS